MLKIHENDHLSEEEIQQRVERWKGCLNHPENTEPGMTCTKDEVAEWSLV